MVNLTTKVQEPIVSKEPVPKKIPAPIPNVNVWQLKKQAIVPETPITSNSKFFFLFFFFNYQYI